MPYETRATNVEAHPGWPDLPTPRRSTQEVAEDNAKKAQEKDASEKAKKRALEKAAMLENQTQRMDEEEKNTRVTRSMRPTKPPAKSGSKSAASGNQVPSTSHDGVADLDGSSAPKRAGKSNKRKLEEDQTTGSGAAGNKATVNHDGTASDGSVLTELEDTPMPKAKKARKATSKKGKKAKKSGPADKKAKQSEPVGPVTNNLRDTVKALREKSVSESLPPLAELSPPTTASASTPKGDACDLSASHGHAQSSATASSTVSSHAAAHQEMDVDVGDTDSDNLRNWISGVTGPTTIRTTAVPATPLSRPPPTPAAKLMHGKAREESAFESKEGADDKTDTELQPKRHRGKPKPRPVVKSKPQEANQVVDKGPVASEDESVERQAAMSSPLKGGTARLTSKNMVMISDVDVSTPNPLRVKDDAGKDANVSQPGSTEMKSKSGNGGAKSKNGAKPKLVDDTKDKHKHDSSSTSKSESNDTRDTEDKPEAKRKKGKDKAKGKVDAKGRCEEENHQHEDDVYHQHNNDAEDQREDIARSKDDTRDRRETKRDAQSKSRAKETRESKRESKRKDDADKRDSQRKDDAGKREAKSKDDAGKREAKSKDDTGKREAKSKHESKGASDANDNRKAKHADDNRKVKHADDAKETREVKSKHHSKGKGVAKPENGGDAKGKGVGREKGKVSKSTKATDDDDSDIEMLDDTTTTSKPVSTVSRASSSTSKSSSSGKKSTTNDLPDGAQDHDRWSSMFVPTLLRFQGCRHDPWTWDSRGSVPVIQKIWDAVYGDSLPHTVVAGDNVHKVASQRVYDWRSGMAATAVSIFETCFNSTPSTRFSQIIPDDGESQQQLLDRVHAHLVDVQAARSKFCTKINEEYAFVWRDPIACANGGPKQGLFHSPFILPVLAMHLEQTSHAVDVPNLFNPTHREWPTSPDRPIGAIGLATAAVERVVFCWRLKRIALNEKGKPYCPPVLNPATGKKSTTSTDFSASNFLRQTEAFKMSAARMGEEQMSALLAAAARIQKGAGGDTAALKKPTKNALRRDQLFEQDTEYGGGGVKREEDSEYSGGIRIKQELDSEYGGGRRIKQEVDDRMDVDNPVDDAADDDGAHARRGHGRAHQGVWAATHDDSDDSDGQSDNAESDSDCDDRDKQDEEYGHDEHDTCDIEHPNTHAADEHNDEHDNGSDNTNPDSDETDRDNNNNESSSSSDSDGNSDGNSDGSTAAACRYSEDITTSSADESSSSDDEY